MLSDAELNSMLEGAALRAFPNMFSTGSRVYGTPREDSDLDIVILTDSEGLEALCAEFEPHPEATDYSDAITSLTGPSEMGYEINYIVTTDPVMFQMYKLARKLCLAVAPVTREIAVGIHEVLRDDMSEGGPQSWASRIVESSEDRTVFPPGWSVNEDEYEPGIWLKSDHWPGAGWGPFETNESAIQAAWCAVEAAEAKRSAQAELE